MDRKQQNCLDMHSSLREQCSRGRLSSDSDSWSTTSPSDPLSASSQSLYVGAGCLAPIIASSHRPDPTDLAREFPYQ
ncbi:MAG: hypothetical protein WDW38_009629 [Sanguina aurantia]